MNEVDRHALNGPELDAKAASDLCALIHTNPWERGGLTFLDGGPELDFAYRYILGAGLARSVTISQSGGTWMLQADWKGGEERGSAEEESDDVLHAEERHPGWEYSRSSHPSGQRLELPQSPPGQGWEINVHRVSRVRKYRESEKAHVLYWMRPKGQEGGCS